MTFRDAALRHGTNVDALALWLARPEIQQRVAALESAIAHRARLVASCFLSAAVKTVKRIIDEYNDEESNYPLDDRIPRHGEYRRRARETARRAASLLLRLAKFSPGAPTPPPPGRARCIDRASDQDRGGSSEVHGRTEPDALAMLFSPSASEAPYPGRVPGNPSLHGELPGTPPPRGGGSSAPAGRTNAATGEQSRSDAQTVEAVAGFSPAPDGAEDTQDFAPLHHSRAESSADPRAITRARPPPAPA